jgi:hypothetical protein
MRPRRYQDRCEPRFSRGAFGSASADPGDATMLDLLFIASGLALFFASLGYAAFCERIG